MSRLNHHQKTHWQLIYSDLQYLKLMFSTLEMIQIKFVSTGIAATDSGIIQYVYLPHPFERENMHEQLKQDCAYRAK